MRLAVELLVATSCSVVAETEDPLAVAALEALLVVDRGVSNDLLHLIHALVTLLTRHHVVS